MNMCLDQLLDTELFHITLAWIELNHFWIFELVRCVKSVCIGSFSGLYFPTLGLNTVR